MTILEQYSTTERQTGRHDLQSLRRALYRYCLALTRSGFEAEDLAQDTWSKALGYGKLSDNPNPEALLLRIAKNTWIDGTRRKSSLSRAYMRGQTLVGTVLVPASGLWEIETVFQSLINHMSPLQRAVFVMRDVLGYTAGESSEILKTSEGAVKAALHRARKALRRVREELQIEEGPALPADADYRSYLRALADSYDKGQILVMLELLQQDHTADLTMAVSTNVVEARQFTGHYPVGGYGSFYDLRMAA